MRYLVTGCAGFVGSTLTDRLLAEGHEVVGIDDFSTGRETFVEHAVRRRTFTLVRGDLRDAAVTVSAARGADAIVHLAANADVRFGTEHPTLDLEQNTVVTVNVLEAARTNGVRTVLFSSTGSVYGDASVVPTPEDAPMPIQTSLYGASKLAAEGFIEAYAEGFGIRALIFRFVSLLGERYTHGHVVDFVRQLREHPDRLHVLGNGQQRKSYLYVGDCVDAMLRALDAGEAKVGVYNLGTDEYCRVVDSVGWICETLGVAPEAHVLRRRTRVDRRQPVHLPRLHPHARAGLGADDVDPRRRRADGALAGRGRRVTIAVVGLWHLGTVTAAALAAEGHRVVAVDEPDVVDAIRAGRLPVDEPGLAELIAEQVAANRLTFASDPAAAAGAEVVWITFDTPVDDADRPDVEWVLERTTRFLDAFPGGAVVAVSSQMPVGSIALLEARSDARFRFAAIPENLRLGSAIGYFRAPDRFVAGVRDAASRAVVERAVGGFAPAIEWMTVESAEMTKHAINAFLATSVAFANELASVCERVGADAREVERGLKSDARIGRKAYVRAGEPFAGGTLARDLSFLRALGDREHLPLLQLRATAASNEQHRAWTVERVADATRTVPSPRVALLGLVYKPGTNTLRASTAVALARRLHDDGIAVTAFDPAIAPDDDRVSPSARVVASADDALHDADVAVIATAWPAFREISLDRFERMRHPVVVDPARFLEDRLAQAPGIRYVGFGRSPEAGVRS